MSEELAQLKERADLLGIKYKANIGVEALSARISAKLNDEPDPVEEEALVPEAKAEAPVKEKTKAQTEQEIRETQAAQQLRLVRLRITNLNPMKAHMQGEIITVGNRYLGTVRKMVLFGEPTDEGYHVPWIIYQELLSRKFNQIRLRKGANGLSYPESRLVNEFALEVLPDLTEEEIERLARKQAAAAGI